MKLTWFGGENATKTTLEALNVDENNEKVYEEQEVDENKEDKEKEDEDDEEEKEDEEEDDEDDDELSKGMSCNRL